MDITEADRKRMGTPDPALLAALEKSPFPDLSKGDPQATVQDIRHNRAAHLARLRHLYPIPGPIPEDVEEIDHHVPARDGADIPIRIYIPTKPMRNGQARPLIVMFHEGGWRMGDLSDEDQNCRLFARDIGAVCVNVDYRLAPEHPFPTGVNDAYDTIKWCATTSSPSSAILPADPRAAGFLVGGASAGGNFAAVICQIARDEALDPPLTGQYLCVPALLDASVVSAHWTAHYRSRAESQHDPVIKPDPTNNQRRRDILSVEPADPRYSPLLHEDLTGLPPAYFQLGGLDPLRDEALIYEHVLRRNGTPTKLQVYDGFGHMFWTNWPEMQRSVEFVQDTRAGVEWLLEQK